MVAAIAVRSGTGTVIVKKTAAHIEVTGAAANTAAGVQRRYYLLADAPAGVDDLRSHVFGPSSDGKHTWNDVLFPAAGSWTLRLRKIEDDTDEATLALTVAAS